MENVFLNGRATKDIDSLVDRLLKDSGISEPPVSLDVVRDRLKLDLAYYSSTDTSAVRETVHRIKVAGKQILSRPSLLWEAIRKFDLRALYVPDRKRILLDAEVPKLKQRWGEAHEIGHSVIPWHDAVMHGDLSCTLSLACQVEVEAEAHYAAGRLIFLGDRFIEELRSELASFDHIRRLSKLFQNSMTTTLWRTVEALETPACALVSCHPRSYSGSPAEVRYFVRSSDFVRQFGHVGDGVVFGQVRNYCTRSRGPLGEDEIVLVDTNGDDHVFYFETFFNGHEALTFGVHRVKCTAELFVL